MPLTSEEQIDKARRAKKINELARSIKKKHTALKLGKFEEDEALEKVFKPVTRSLKTIQIKEKPVKIEPKEEVKKETSTKEQSIDAQERSIEAQERLAKTINMLMQSINESRQPTFLPEQSMWESTALPPAEYDNNLLNETIDLSTVDPEVLESYLDDYPEIARPYILEHNNKDPKIDPVYGPVYDAPQSKWILGKKLINFEKSTGDIIVDGKHRYKGTEGLYNLVFYDDPKATKEDREAYRHLLSNCGAHQNTLGRLKGTNRTKYINVIKPLFTESVFKKPAIPKPTESVRRRAYSTTSPPTTPLEPSRRRSSSYSSPTKGKGLRLTYNSKPVEYLFWDDVNELVDRLKLLMASKNAGNTSLDNEIVAIINELKEANIIN